MKGISLSLFTDLMPSETLIDTLRLLTNWFSFEAKLNIFLIPKIQLENTL